MDDKGDMLEAAWDGLIAAGRNPDVLDEALAGIEAEEPEIYETLRRAFSPAKGWNG